MILTHDAMIIGWPVVLAFLAVDIAILIVYSVLRYRAQETERERMAARHLDVMEVLEKIRDYASDSFKIHEQDAETLLAIQNAVEKED